MVDYPESAAHLPPGRRPADRTVHPLPQESIHDRILIGLLSFQLFHGYFIPIFMALFAYSNYREYKNAPF